MDTDFDFEWEIRGSDGLNVTERKLFEAMKKIGLNPECMYKISMMTVDFAFPEVKIAIEVNGPYHDTDEQKIIDKRRYFTLKSFGWKVKTFKADEVYEYPEKIANTIRKILNKVINEEEEEMSSDIHDPEPARGIHGFDWKKRLLIISLALLVVIGIIIFSNIREIKPLIVEGTSTDVIITNNQARSVSLNVNYQVYSKWFGANYIVSAVFNVGANSKQRFRVYDNIGCSANICSINIVSYNEI